MKKMLVLIALLGCHVVFAAGGDHAGNGGDACENRFNTIRNDIRVWISSGGASGLTLPEAVDLKHYNSVMIANIDQAKVSCTNEKLKIGIAEKTCINQTGTAIIECNIDRFMQMAESDQYILVHHEYAGLSGLEVNVNEESDYSISNQLSYFLENQVIKKLAIKPAPPKPSADPESECSTASMMPLIISSLKDYVKDVAKQRSLDFVEESINVTYLGKQDFRDDKNAAVTPNQNAFEINFLTKRGSKMIFLSASYGLCEDKLGLCYFAYSGAVVGLPEPALILTKDAEGFVTSRKCVQYSYDKYNRHILLFNETLKETVHTALISYEKPILASRTLKLK